MLAFYIYLLMMYEESLCFIVNWTQGRCSCQEWLTAIHLYGQTILNVFSCFSFISVTHHKWQVMHVKSTGPFLVPVFPEAVVQCNGKNIIRDVGEKRAFFLFSHNTQHTSVISPNVWGFLPTSSQEVPLCRFSRGHQLGILSFQYCLPGHNARSHKRWGKFHQLFPHFTCHLASTGCGLCLWRTGCKPGFPTIPSQVWLIC